MTCRACSIIEQIALNTALILDKTLNTTLLGDPNETLSRRIARASLAGERWAARACKVLTWIFELIGSDHDHCAWSLQPGSVGREVWAWSPVEGAQKTVSAPVSMGQADAQS